MALFGGGKVKHDPAVLLQKGDAAGAAKLLRKHLKKAPDDHRKRNMLGDALVACGDVKGALAEYERVADGYVSDGFTAKALAIWKKMARLSPEDEDLLARIAGLSGTSPGIPRPAADGSDALRETPLFPDFRPEEFAELARTIEHRRFDPDERIVSEGEAGDSLFVIAEGAVRVTMTQGDREIELGRLGPGDFFGETAVLKGLQRTATIHASEPCEVLELRREDLARLVEVHPRVREVMEEFNRKRAESTVEAIVESRRGEGP